MEGSISPIVKKLTGEVTGNKNRPFSPPTQVCLGDWWLSKPDDGNGIAVSGHPYETRRYDTKQQFHSPSAKKRFAMREFHSKQIIKRHDCTTVECPDGFTVYLCGLINRSRTLQNGFSAEVCRDFIYGFPFNWEKCAAQSGPDKSSHSDNRYFSDHFLPAAMDTFNGAQLHDLVLSLTDTERDVFTKKMYDNLRETMNPELFNAMNIQPSNSNPSSPVDADILTPKSTMRKVTTSRNGETVSTSENSKKDVGILENTATGDILTPKSTMRKVTTSRNGETVNMSENSKKDEGILEITATGVLTTRNRAYKRATNINNSRTAKKKTVSSKAFAKQGSLQAAKNIIVLGLCQLEGFDQSKKRSFVERLNSVDQKPKRKRGTVTK